MPRIPAFAATAIALIISSAGAHAQWSCPAPGWSPSYGGDILEAASLVAFDPDGPGPAHEKLLIAGVFIVPGIGLTHNVATLDLATSTWNLLPALTGSVSDVVVMPDGDFIAGGFFGSSFGTALLRVARWDGSAWSPLDSGINGFVESLLVRDDGVLLVGGQFAFAGGVPANGIAAWDGSSWSALSGPGGPSGGGVIGSVLAIAQHPSGDIYVGGQFSITGSGVIANRIARFDGATWHGLNPPNGLFGSHVDDIAFLPNGDVVAAGQFNLIAAGNSPNIARYNGTGWQAMGNGLSGFAATSLATLPGGQIIVGGNFINSGSVFLNNVGLWDGVKWNSIGPNPVGVGLSVSDVALLASGDVVFGGSFQNAGGTQVKCVARFGCSDPCYADCDGNGVLDFFDFLCFQNQFTGASLLADCDQSGALDFFDFLCFQNAFTAGCP